ncbi:MAG: ATP-binding protein [Spirochaetaceae bacterium]|nr:ATP-binding protein [Spirochaetaceae bacterium]
MVKILTGIRRGGKSHLLHLMIEYLKNQGVDSEHIIYHNFENLTLPELYKKNELQKYIDGLLQNEGKFYIFLDEIQVIPGWEKTLPLFFPEQRIEFFVAASGTSLKKIAKRKEKYVDGNYTEIQINPLSYSEYRKAQKEVPHENRGLLQRAIAIRIESRAVFTKYIQCGGFPAALCRDDTEKKTALNDIYASVVFYDVISKHKINNPELLAKVIQYIFQHIGSEASAKKLKDFFISKRYTKDLSKIQSYLNHLEEAFFLKKIRRINIKTKKVQRIKPKYYAGDHALISSVCGNNGPEPCSIMENILVNELENRGFTVYCGSVNKSIIEFVAEKENTLLFIQTVNHIRDNIRTLNEKLSALNDIPIINEQVRKVKYLLFFGETEDIEQIHGDIKQLSLNDFLLSGEY